MEVASLVVALAWALGVVAFVPLLAWTGRELGEPWPKVAVVAVVGGLLWPVVLLDAVLSESPRPDL